MGLSHYSRLFVRATVLFMVSSTIAPGQTKGATAAKPTAPILMPVDRASDSYRIYSSLMPLGETAGKAWPHKLWLVQNTTVTVISPDEPCQVKPTSQPDAASLLSMGMNPHVAVRPSDDRRQDFVEILKDWDGHCHDRILLDPNAWHTSVPVRLLNPAAQERYRASRTNAHRNSNTDNFSDAPALYGFSEVFFNSAHTVALVYATHYCGRLCGQGFWVALELQNGVWKPLPWDSSSWIS